MDGKQFKSVWPILKDGAENTLQTCPFCGRRESKIVWKEGLNNGYFIFVKCGLCRAQSGAQGCSDKITDIQNAVIRAAEAWNRRA